MADRILQVGIQCMGFSHIARLTSAALEALAAVQQWTHTPAYLHGGEAPRSKLCQHMLLHTPSWRAACHVCRSPLPTPRRQLWPTAVLPACCRIRFRNCCHCCRICCCCLCCSTSLLLSRHSAVTAAWHAALAVAIGCAACVAAAWCPMKQEVQQLLAGGLVYEVVYHHC